MDKNNKINHYSSCPAITLVTDCSDQLALSECQLVLTREFYKHQRNPVNLITSGDIESFNILHGAFYLYELTTEALPGEIFIGVVDPGVGTERKEIIIQTKKDYFLIGPDNGLLLPAAQRDGISLAWEINKNRFGLKISNTFHGRDIFSKAAALIACGLSPTSLGQEINKPQLENLELKENQVVHIDKFGNLKIFTKIPENLKPKAIILDIKKSLVIPLAKTFTDVKRGEFLAYAGSSGYLEIAARETNAAKLINCSIGDYLKIDWVY